MAITPTFKDTSPLSCACYCYEVAGLVNGANAIALPVPPKSGSFPVAGDWTPTRVLCFPDNPGSIGALVTIDNSTISNSSGSITFTLYSNGTTNCFIIVL